MAYTSTQTISYTISDISKVVDMFAGDYSMVAQATGLETQDDVAAYVFDIKSFAKNDYLDKISLCLCDSSNNVIRAATYDVVKDATSGSPSRPGNNLWPRTPGGTLAVIVSYSAGWRDLPEARKNSFRSTLKRRWTPSSIDTSFPGLQSSVDRLYASNGYGLRKQVYK